MAGNRTRASRVAGENSTTEPPMHVKTQFGMSFRVPPDKSISGQLPKTRGTQKTPVSPSGNRTPVSRVTGGDTLHYTNEDMFGEFSLSVKNGVLASRGPFSHVLCLENNPAKRAHHQRVRLVVPDLMVGPTVLCDLRFWS